ncbi:hypothetical protein [Scytonema sp. NUACC21]
MSILEKRLRESVFNNETSHPLETTLLSIGADLGRSRGVGWVEERNPTLQLNVLTGMAALEVAQNLRPEIPGGRGRPHHKTQEICKTILRKVHCSCINSIYQPW